MRQKGKGFLALLTAAALLLPLFLMHPMTAQAAGKTIRVSEIQAAMSGGTLQGDFVLQEGDVLLNDTTTAFVIEYIYQPYPFDAADQAEMQSNYDYHNNNFNNPNASDAEKEAVVAEFNRRMRVVYDRKPVYDYYVTEADGGYYFPGKTVNFGNGYIPVGETRRPPAKHLTAGSSMTFEDLARGPATELRITGITYGGTTISIQGKGIRAGWTLPAPAAPASASHVHKYEWRTIREATAEYAGEQMLICTECGEIVKQMPLSGFGIFQKETRDKILKAAQGATVEITTSHWISFHKIVMEALASRPDVTLKVSFLEGEYKGPRYILTIPAGINTMALLNEEGYSGFKYLWGVLGTVVPAN